MVLAAALMLLQVMNGHCGRAHFSLNFATNWWPASRQLKSRWEMFVSDRSKRRRPDGERKKRQVAKRKKR
jgi:hypothetical protein